MNLRMAQDLSIAYTDFGSVVLDAARGTYWQLNPTGTVIAEGLFAGRGVDDITRQLVSDFEVPEPVARADVTALLDELLDAGLLLRGRS